jgi:hypothetical protein
MTKGGISRRAPYDPNGPDYHRLYPHSYPQTGRNPAELAVAHRNNRTQPEPAGRLPRFRYAVPISPSNPVLSVNRGLNVGGDADLEARPRLTLLFSQSVIALL